MCTQAVPKQLFEVLLLSSDQMDLPLVPLERDLNSVVNGVVFVCSLHQERPLMALIHCTLEAPASLKRMLNQIKFSRNCCLKSYVPTYRSPVEPPLELGGRVWWRRDAGEVERVAHRVVPLRVGPADLRVPLRNLHHSHPACYKMHTCKGFQSFSDSKRLFLGCENSTLVCAQYRVVWKKFLIRPFNPFSSRLISYGLQKAVY